MHRYPEDTTVGIEDFIDSGWAFAIKNRKRDGYYGIWSALSNAAKETIDSGRFAAGKALWLMADACSMCIKPKSINEPFSPMFVMSNGRSALPEDFKSEDILIFSEFCLSVDDPWLRARLADLVWLTMKPRTAEFALVAIDAYRDIPLDVENWVAGGRECWERAIALALALKPVAGPRHAEISDAVISAFHSAKHEDGYLALWLADLALNGRLIGGESTAINEWLLEIAVLFESQGEYLKAIDYYDASAHRYEKLGAMTEFASAVAKSAEALVKEASSRLSSRSPSHMVAASLYEDAIQKYRKIPRSERDRLRVNERLSELHAGLTESGTLSLNEMEVIQTPSIDITEVVENSRRAVRGKEPLIALKVLANIHQGIKLSKVREISVEMLRKHPLQSLMAATHMSKDGRVVAVSPGIEFGTENLDEKHVKVWAEMVKYFGMESGFIVRAQIWPAFEELSLEHRIKEHDFIALAKKSPIVPPDREGLFGKGLYAGYEKDFVTAAHLLAPQIEHMVRWHLKEASIKTTMLDRQGVETENGLSTLMELPEAAEIFGEDVAFELRALLSDRFGSNLRNEIAHGLMDEEDFNSGSAVYFWWISLRLVFMAFWNSRRQGNT